MSPLRGRMLKLLKVRRARKAAVAAIAPHVERSRWRLHGIPEGTWCDPYMVGFLAMLITLFAQKEVRSLDGQSLGLVQLDAWGQITRTDAGSIGEEITLLSANGDAAFELGCNNARQVFRAIERAPSATDEQGGPGSLLWARYFDDRVSTSGTWSPEPL
jgi:hypothetical protein